MKIKINGSSLIYAILVIVLTVDVFTTYGGLNRSLVYICDVLVIGLLLLLLLNAKLFQYLTKFKPSVFLLLLFLLWVAGFLYNDYSIKQFVWGLRNNFRFFIFFLAVLLLGKEEYIEKVQSLLMKLSVVNFLLVLVQYFLFHNAGDYLGGLFGVEKGCNSDLNIYLVILIAIALVRFYYKKLGVIWFIFIIGSSMLIAALSELKIFYVELACLFIVMFLVTKMSLRKAVCTMIGVMGLLIGVNIMYRLFPRFDSFFTISNMINESMNYATEDDLGRYTAIERLDTMLYDGEAADPRRWIGIGLGQADYADALPSFDSDFYKRYEKLHYTWISSAFVFIEQGYLGIVLNLLLYIAIALWCLVRVKKEENPIYYWQTFLVSGSCILLFFYNTSLRTNMAYLIYYMLGIAFIYRRKNENIVD